MRNKSICRIGLIVIVILASTQMVAFDYTVKLREKTFKKTYHFLVRNFVDARFNKEKPIGVIPDFFYKPKTVGNDSLESQINNFLRVNWHFFVDSSTKIIMVLKQLNLHYFQGYSMLSGKIQYIETTASFDYYEINDQLCRLVYQQFLKHKTSVKFILKRSKGNDVALSSLFSAALGDFEKQLKSFPDIQSTPINIFDLYNSLNVKKIETIKHPNIPDGIYFSCHDVYMEKVGELPGIVVPESELYKGSPVILHSDKYNIEKAFAIVKSGRIFIYTQNGLYKEASVNTDGILFFPEASQKLSSDNPRQVLSALGMENAPFGFLRGALDAIKQNRGKNSRAPKPDFYVLMDTETGDFIWNAK